MEMVPFYVLTHVLGLMNWKREEYLNARHLPQKQDMLVAGHFPLIFEHTCPIYLVIGIGHLLAEAVLKCVACLVEIDFSIFKESLSAYLQMSNVLAEHQL